MYPSNRSRENGNFTLSGQSKTLAGQTKVTEEVLQDLYVGKKWSAAKIAAKFDVSKAYVCNQLQRFGLPVRSRGRSAILTVEHVKFIRMMANAGFSTKQIVEKLDDLPRPVSDKTVYDVIAYKTHADVV